ncbi:MAG TPA: CoA pyrophosphatase [Acidimicrobiales bacterium]
MSGDGTPTNARGGPQRIPRPPGTKRGQPPPWAHLDPGQRRVSIDDVVRAFASGRAPRPALVERFRPRASAVLAALYEDGGEAHVVLTRRSRHLRSHRWEVAFPGGRQDEGEDAVATALREANEEVALPPDKVEVIGELDHLATISSGSFIVPVVGVLDAPPALTPNPAEVERVLHVPLSELLDPQHFREERWGLGPVDRPIYFFELVGDTVWGATGAMLVDLLGRITGTDPERGI